MTPAARPLCSARHCRVRGRHYPDCLGEQCPGCLPRLAADGLRLCPLCTELLAKDARDAAELYEALALRLLPNGAGGERVDASQGWRTPDPRAMEARRDIRHELVSLVRMICEERGIAQPVDEMPPATGRCPVWGCPHVGDCPDHGTRGDYCRPLGEFVAQHSVWLAAHPAAEEFAGELRELVSRSWRVCYPSGARVAEVGRCPMDGCAGTLRSVVHAADSLLPARITCDADNGHAWSADQWHALGRAMRRVA